MDTLILIGGVVIGALAWLGSYALFSVLSDRPGAPDSIKDYYPEDFSDDKLERTVLAVAGDKWRGLRPAHIRKVHRAIFYREDRYKLLAQYYYKCGDSGMYAAEEANYARAKDFREHLENRLQNNNGQA